MLADTGRSVLLGTPATARVAEAWACCSMIIDHVVLLSLRGQLSGCFACHVIKKDLEIDGQCSKCATTETFGSPAVAVVSGRLQSVSNMRWAAFSLRHAAGGWLWQQLRRGRRARGRSWKSTRLVFLGSRPNSGLQDVGLQRGDADLDHDSRLLLTPRSRFGIPAAS